MKRHALDFHGLDVNIEAYTDDNEVEIVNVYAFHGGKLLNDYFTTDALREMESMLYQRIFVQGDDE